jgi:hypothetical protein
MQAGAQVTVLPANANGPEVLDKVVRHVYAINDLHYSNIHFFLYHNQTFF